MISGERRVAYDTLMAAIGWGDLDVDIPVGVVEAAQRFGLRPDSVKDALFDLRRDGLVTVCAIGRDSASSFMVVEPTAAELRDTMELRVLMEVPAARRVAEAGLAPQKIRRLDELADRVAAAAAAGDLLGYVRADLDFHLFLVGLTGNTELVDLVRVLRVRSRIRGLPTTGSLDFMTVKAAEHRRLIDHVVNAEVTKIDLLLRNHIATGPAQ